MSEVIGSTVRLFYTWRRLSRCHQAKSLPPSQDSVAENALLCEIGQLKLVDSFQIHRLQDVYGRETSSWNTQIKTRQPLRREKVSRNERSSRKVLYLINGQAAREAVGEKRGKSERRKGNGWAEEGTR